MSLIGFYTGLIDVFKEHAIRCNLRVSNAVPTQIKTKKNTGVAFSLSEPLIIDTDIAPGASGTKHLCSDGHILQIYICPWELYQNAANYQIQQSKIEIAYVLHTKELKAKLILGLHFDFDVDGAGNPKPNHPLFHMQMSHRLIELHDRLISDEVDIEHMLRLPISRLPTAHMSFAATLINLAADNFSEPEFKSFLRHIRENKEFPHMKNGKFHQRMTEHEWKMRSCAWYA